MGVGDGQELEVRGGKFLLGLGNKCFLVLRKSLEIPWYLKKLLGIFLLFHIYRKESRIISSQRIDPGDCNHLPRVEAKNQSLSPPRIPRQNACKPQGFFGF